MPKSNACFILDNDTSNSVNILKVAIPLKEAIILAPPAKVRIGLMQCVLAIEINFTSIKHIIQMFKITIYTIK